MDEWTDMPPYKEPNRRRRTNYKTAVDHFDLGVKQSIEKGIQQNIEEGIREGKIEALLVTLCAFKVQYTFEDEDLLRSYIFNPIDDDAKFDEILIAIIQSQGKAFQNILSKMK